MKRSLKALLVTAAATAALAGPAATPAHAGTCVGVWYDEFGPDRFVAWSCSSCPSLAGLGDGRVWVVTCFT